MILWIEEHCVTGYTTLFTLLSLLYGRKKKEVMSLLTNIHGLKYENEKIVAKTC